MNYKALFKAIGFAVMMLIMVFSGVIVRELGWVDSNGKAMVVSLVVIGMIGGSYCFYQAFKLDDDLDD